VNLKNKPNAPKSIPNKAGRVSTDLAAAFANLGTAHANGYQTKLRTSAAKRTFDAINARARARRRALVKPENVAEILARLPLRPDRALHVITPGNFIFCDLITAIAERFPTQRLLISTLSFSKRNADALCKLITDGKVGSVSMLTSNYFAKTNAAILAHFEQGASKSGGFQIGIARTHAKVTAFQFTDGARLVIETSANLRSSDNIEQVSLFADVPTFDFHAEWIQQVINENPKA
jgi:hypothetical protein